MMSPRRGSLRSEVLWKGVFVKRVSVKGSLWNGFSRWRLSQDRDPPPLVLRSNGRHWNGRSTSCEREFLWKGYLWMESPPPPRTETHLPWYWHLVAATEVDGTHPTGMHSCFTTDVDVTLLPDEPHSNDVLRVTYFYDSQWCNTGCNNNILHITLFYDRQTWQRDVWSFNPVSDPPE